jgi:hypothetical protein
MTEERSLEGWAPVVGRDGSLPEIVELALDYRGDVTVTRTDGSELTGYVYNRDGRGPDASLDMVDPDGVVHRLRYADLRALAFTGKDAAAGKSYEAWRRRKAEGRAEAAVNPSP